jgi:hypothetical protein
VTRFVGGTYLGLVRERELEIRGHRQNGESQKGERRPTACWPA